MSVTLQNVTRTVDGVPTIRDVSLTLERGTLSVLLGPTLSGKTSIMRLLAGLDKPATGRVLVDGKDVTGADVRQRSVAMVYQQFINYPSLTVYENIASPLRVQGKPKAEIEKRVAEAAALLRLEPFLKRTPLQLSGGQQQRTAIARALVKGADLVLLDEPLANLDYKLREELRAELPRIFEASGAIFVYATTEPSEALLLGGDTVCMWEGQALQTGATPKVYRHPDTLRVAQVFSDPPLNIIGIEKKGDRVTYAGGEQAATSGAVQAGVADDGRLLGLERAAGRRGDHQLAAGHALADVVVGVAFQVQVQAAGVPDAEALPRRALEAEGNRRVLHALVAVLLGDLAGHARTDGAVAVADVQFELATGLAGDGGLGQLDHLLGQQALVERRVLLDFAELRLVGRDVIAAEQRGQVQVALLAGLARQHVEQIGTPDQLAEAAHAQLGQPLAGFLGDELEEVDHHVDRADEVILAQLLVLGCDAGGAVVEGAKHLQPRRVAGSLHHRVTGQRAGDAHRREHADAAVVGRVHHPLPLAIGALLHLDHRYAVGRLLLAHLGQWARLALVDLAGRVQRRVDVLVVHHQQAMLRCILVITASLSA